MKNKLSCSKKLLFIPVLILIVLMVACTESPEKDSPFNHIGRVLGINRIDHMYQGNDNLDTTPIVRPGVTPAPTPLPPTVPPENITVNRGASEGLALIYESATNSYTILGIGICTDKDIVIPNTANDCPVTAISDEAFINCTEVRSITMDEESNITHLGTKAFYGCTGLEEVHLSGKITQINPFTFSGCVNISNLTIPHVNKIATNGFSGVSTDILTVSCDSLSANSFDNCKAKTINLNITNFNYIPSNCFANTTRLENLVIEGNKLVNIMAYAFNGSELKNLTLPTSLKEIDRLAFVGCRKIQTIDFSGSKVRLSPNLFLECSLLTAFENYENILESDLFSLNIRHTKLLTVENDMHIGFDCLYSFNKTGYFAEVTIPEGVRAIAEAAFSREDLTIGILNLPSTLEIIYDRAFYYVTIEAELRIPQGIELIYPYAFSAANLSSLYLPDSIGQTSHLDFYQIGNIDYISVGKITPDFGALNLDFRQAEFDIYFRGTVAEFNYDYSDSFFAKKTIRCIDGNVYRKVAYRKEGTVELTITSDMCATLTGTGIVSKNFEYTYGSYETKIRKLIISEGITEFEHTIYGDGFMENAINLEEIQLPSTLTSIGQSFDNTRWMANFNQTGQCLYGVGNTLMLVADNYQGTLKVKEGTVRITKYALSGCSKIEQIILPQGLEVIERMALYGCGVRDISFPDSVTSIEYGAFNECDNLVNITLPVKLTEINSIFSNCDNLKKVIFPANDACAFTSSAISYCPEAEILVLGEGFTSLPINTVYECKKMKVIYLPSTITSVDYNAFWTLPKTTLFACATQEVADLINTSFNGLWSGRAYVEIYQE